MKYPVDNLIRVIRADQRVARRCYDESTRVLVDGESTLCQRSLELHQQTKIGASLNLGVEKEVVWILRENRDAFAWTPADMSGIDLDFLCHHLSITLGACPVSQKKRRLEEEKKRAIKAKIAKLLQARFIWEVRYPSWLSNVLMVKKSSGKWRICTDYIDLNRACPKDPYPLPNIDALTTKLYGHLLGLQSTQDASKMTFITDEGDFCYGVMPFSLKNAGATYQRLMDWIFKDHIENQLEVYVDDMVVKSKKETGHAENLASIFKVLRRYQLRLNPKKCSFGVKAGKFLDFMLTKRGIKANLEKFNIECEVGIVVDEENHDFGSFPIFQRLRKAKHFR
ncbi:hypothetical protein CR513_25221, partial [Mucuna pruriens]